MGVSLAGDIQREQRWGISWLPVHLYMEDKRQRQNKADIMMLGLMGGRDRVSDNWATLRPVIGWFGGRGMAPKGFGTGQGEVGQMGIRRGGSPYITPI